MRLMKNRTLAAALLAPLVLAACESERGPMDPTSVRPQANLIVGGIQITKTAEGYNRSKVDYDWTLEKTVTPTSGSLAQGASATFQYTLTATRTLASSTAASTGVAGQICLTNTNTTTVTVNGVEDIIQKSVKGGPWEIVAITAVPLNGVTQIAGGQSHCYSYDIPLTPQAFTAYRNWGAAYVTNPTAQLETLEAPNPFSIPATPSTSETDATADLSDLLSCPTGFTCSAGPGPWTLTGSQVINYAITVKNVSAPCGHTDVVENTATLTEGTSGQTHTDEGAVTVSTPTCDEPGGGTQGCTPGYWKQKQHFASWVGFTPTGVGASKYNTVFGVNLFSSSFTLLQALGQGGGGAARLGRHSTAALLNTANSGVDYGMTTAQVIAEVQAAVASGNYDLASDKFEKMNEMGCPLGRAE